MVKTLFNEAPVIADQLEEDERLALANGDSLAFSKSLPANFFSLIISSRLTTSEKNMKND